MIHKNATLLITPENRHLYQSNLDEMFELRYKVFKEKLGWSLPTSTFFEGQEKDEYDRLDTHYILYLNENGKVTGCARLLSTLSNHMIKNSFPFMMANNSFIENDQVWEISRFAVYSQNQKLFLLNQINPITYALCHAIMEFGSLYNIKEFIFVTTPGFCRILKIIGWRINYISKIFSLDDVKSIVGSVSVNSIINGL